MRKKTTKYSAMTYEQEVKEALKAIRCYKKEKKEGKLQVAKKASDFLYK